MRLVNPLHLKKIIKNIIGVNYLNRRIDEAIVEKASHNKVNELKNDVIILKEVVQLLLEENSNKENQAKISRIIENIGEPKEITTEHIEDKKFIFVCGLHRSGTSLFTKIIQNHPSISGFENTGVLKDEGQFLQTVYLPERDLGWAGSFGFSKEAHMTENSRLVSENSRNKIYRQWSNYWDSGKEFLIEKTPSNLLKTRFLQALFPNSYFITIRRHPIATAMATKKWSKSSMSSLIKHWIRCYDIWDEDKKYLKNCIEIKYEDFMLDPNGILKSVCELCELGNIESLNMALRKYTLSKKVNDKYFNEWNKLTIQKKFIEIRYKKDFERHGYSVDMD